MVIEYVYGEYCVEVFEFFWQVFQGQWQVLGWQFWQVVFGGEELVEEQLVWIDFDYVFCVGVEYVLLVVVVVVVDVEDVFVMQFDMW